MSEPSHGKAAPESNEGIAAKAFYARAALIISLAAILRLVLAGRYQMLLDEAYCFETATKGIRGLVGALGLGNEPPLHLAVLYYWMKIFGESAFALRSLSAAASAGTVAAVVLWEAPWFSRRARLMAAFILAITPIAIYYGQVTRMYSLLVLVVVLSMICLERGLRNGAKRDWALFAIFTALALYTSYVAIYLVPVGYLVIGAMYVSREDRGAAGARLRSLILAHAAAAALFAPWLPVFFEQPTSAAVRWIKPVWARSDKVMLPLASLSIMTTGGGYYPNYLSYLWQDASRTRQTREAIEEGKETNPLLKAVTAVNPVVPLAVSSVLAAVTVIAALASGGRFPHRTFVGGWLLLSFSVPILLSFVRPLFVVGRYELPGVAAFAILVGIGLDRMPRGLRAVCVATATALFLYSWTYMCCWPTQGNAPQKGMLLAKTATAGDVILCEAFEYSPMYYYAGSGRDRLTFLTAPRETIGHSAWLDFDKWFEPPEYRTATAALTEEAASAVEEAVKHTAPGRLLIVLRPISPCAWEKAMHDAVSGPIERAVSAGLIVRDERASQEEWGIYVFGRTAVLR